MEFLDDYEKRILLCAIRREKKVCEQVDKESCITILTDICKSLEYKFMYDRLFTQIYEQGRTDGINEYFNAFDTWVKSDSKIAYCWIEFQKQARIIADQLKSIDKCPYK